jgi:hypothetical protein
VTNVQPPGGVSLAQIFARQPPAPPAVDHLEQIRAAGLDPALLALAELHQHEFDKEVARAFVDPDAAGKLAGKLQIEPGRLNNDIATQAGQAPTVVGAAAEDEHKALQKLVARKITASKVEQLTACDLLGLAARWGAGLLDADLELASRDGAVMAHLHKLFVLFLSVVSRAVAAMYQPPPLRTATASPELRRCGV